MMGLEDGPENQWWLEISCVILITKKKEKKVIEGTLNFNGNSKSRSPRFGFFEMSSPHQP